MSANKIVFSNATLAAIGNYRIVSYAEPFQDVEEILGVEDDVVGIPAGGILVRSFRWSKDGISWSLWIDFTISDLTPLTGVVLADGDYLYAEFRYLIADDPDQSPELEPGTVVSPEVTINSFDFLITYKTVDVYLNYTPATLCSDEFGKTPVLLQKTFGFNPYDINKGVNLYKELSSMVNQTFGHEVNYFRVTPQLRSADVMFKEWTLKQSQAPKCIKILVPNNEFPDSKPQYNQFGIDFEVPFEIHIDRGYWEVIFGKNTMPQENDYLYFPLVNRMYEIQSTYIFRDFMQQPVYFKVALVKYQNRADVLKDADIMALIDDNTLSTDELFGEDMVKEIERHTKPQQYVTITHENDPTRARVNRNIPIVRYDFYNNWTLISEHYYNMTELNRLDSGAVAVEYRAQSKLTATDSRAFTCWFAPDSSIGGNTTRPLLRGRNSSNIGMDIDLVYSTTQGQSQVKLTMNSVVTTFQLTGLTIEKDAWYAIVVNVSNQFAQASVDLWVTQSSTSELKNIYHKALPITATVYDAAEPWKLVASPIIITNVRLFSRMLEEEHQNIVLSQLIVKDSDKALIIDNSKPLLRIHTTTNPK